ncbi:hypothetical protein POV27_17620 [Aureisphaera galaxeae]|uniref:hypothetical protein n=1 Tax=Aureisphaera galaxeae TaxID=1538023 RepID=UPI0023504D71|nr:hypothetical protein [Aureisphaera galaxeae]MDC8005877.1 hypothetical protein [Aureisphaera galaxeae]
MIATTPPFLARVPIETWFCSDESVEIKTALEGLEGIERVRPFPQDKLILFHFYTSHALSCALNALGDLGFEELIH